VRHVVGVVVFAAIVAPVVSATVGVASLRLGGVLAPGRFAEAWGAWWLGDALGALVVAPMLLAWLAGPRPSRPPMPLRRLLEAVGTSIVLAALAFRVLAHVSGGAAAGPLVQPYALFPILVLVALRFGLRGSTAATFLVSAIAVYGAAVGAAPFAAGTAGLRQSLWFVQAFMATVAVTLLVLGAVLAERGEAIRRREEFLTIVSHDLRGPLHAIRLSAEIAARTLAPGSAPAEDGFSPRALAVLASAVRRMEAMIRDLLDQAAIEEGHLRISLGSLDATAMAEEAAAMALPLAEEKALHVSVLGAGGPLEVLCDHERVLQVLSNLLGNAIKFTPKGGVVAIKVEPLAGEARFTVTDSGPGIPPEDLPRVFERYWRGDHRGVGAGLGLSIAKRVVEAHGGKIEAESTPGAGSTFRFTLPATGSGLRPHGARERVVTDS
jgi:signal transduction histidine kinase